MLQINRDISTAGLKTKFTRFWDLSGRKLDLLHRRLGAGKGTPVITDSGVYTPKSWTEWTEGLWHGSDLIQYDATGEEAFLERGRRQTVERMAPQVTHMGVHDHGFNVVSTYGHLLRLLMEGRFQGNEWEQRFYGMAIKCSGAVQAHRWTRIADGSGYIYSFNGPHSLFIDTMRSLRVLALAHQLGHVLREEGDAAVSLLKRLVQHARNTARFNVYYGEKRDLYDAPGRVAHESLFNTMDGTYRCPATQQGYSPFSTWTRGLAWAISGFTEQLEYLDTVPEAELAPLGGAVAIQRELRRAAAAVCAFYVQEMPSDGIPYWDTGAPGLRHLGDYQHRPADPFNEYEPVDSSAAAIAAQGLLRFGSWLEAQGDPGGSQYLAAGLTVLDRLLEAPYLAEDNAHEGLLLHAVYHRPRGWDLVPEGRRVPCGESAMWGDYHLREAVLCAQRLAEGRPLPAFYLAEGPA